MRTYGRRPVYRLNAAAVFSDDEGASLQSSNEVFYGPSSHEEPSEKVIIDEDPRPLNFGKVTESSQNVEKPSTVANDLSNSPFEASAWLFLFASVEAVAPIKKINTDLEGDISTGDDLYTTEDDETENGNNRVYNRILERKMESKESQIHLELEESQHPPLRISSECPQSGESGTIDTYSITKVKNEAYPRISDPYLVDVSALNISKHRKIYGERRSYLETPPQTSQAIENVTNDNSTGLDATDLQQLGKKRRRDEEIEYLVLGLQPECLTSYCNWPIIESCIGIWDLGPRSNGHNELVTAIEELWTTKYCPKRYKSKSSVNFTFLTLALYGLVSAGHKISVDCINQLRAYKMPKNDKDILLKQDHGLLEIQISQIGEFYNSVVLKIEPEDILNGVLVSCSDSTLALQLLCERIDKSTAIPLISAILKESGDMVTQIDTRQLSKDLLGRLNKGKLDTAVLEIAVVLQTHSSDAFKPYLDQFFEAVLRDIDESILQHTSDNNWDFSRLLVELAFLLNVFEHVPDSDHTAQEIFHRLKQQMPTPDTLLHVHVNVYYALIMMVMGNKEVFVHEILRRHGDQIESTALTQRISSLNESGSMNEWMNE